MSRFVPLEAFDHTSHAVLASSAKGLVTYCNRAASELLHCRFGSAIGRPCWEVAGFLDGRQAPFCSPRCPVQKQATVGQIEPFRVALGPKGSLPPVSLEVITFPICRGGSGRHGVLHLLSPVTPVSTTSRPAEGAQFLYRLSPRETEVLRLLASGVGTQEIATILCISVITVRNHVQRILRKLGVHRRIEAVLAFRGLSGTSPIGDRARSGVNDPSGSFRRSRR